MTQINTVAVLGTGVIGASWASLFLAAGLKVRAYDPADEAGEKLEAYIEGAWPALDALGLTANGDRGIVTYYLGAYHCDRLRNHRIHFARHDARTWL